MRMGTEYQIFNGKEYVSLRRFWNMEGKYKTEKAKNEELEEENRLHEKELEYLRKRCKELEYILEHDYNRIVPGGML